MRAAIYARYSSDHQKEASIEDQVRLCRNRIDKEGWHLQDVYSDHAISGATTLRPGYQKMLEDARANRFDVLVAEALDRLSRDQEDIAAIYKRLGHCDVLIFTMAEGEVNELHIGLKGTMNALFLKDLASKIRRGQQGRIIAGLSAGGLSYGYQVVRELDENGNLLRGRRRVNEEEAAIVRRIFAEYVSGKSPRRIAADLNAEEIPAPRGGQWNASTINGHRARRNGILQNDLYRGLLVHNRVRMVKDPETGKRISKINPETEWVTAKVSDLRIVSDDVWNQVQQIKRRHGRQPLHKSRRPRRLLSGLLSCGECDGSFTISRPGKYACASHREKGTCTNGHQISVHQLERRVLSGIQERMRDPILVEEFVREFKSEWEHLRSAALTHTSSIEARYKKLEKQIARIVRAIAEGTDTPALRDALVGLEQEKSELNGKIAVRRAPPHTDLPLNLERLFYQKVDRLHECLNADKQTTREATAILRSIIDKIVLRPKQGRGSMLIEVYSRPEGIFLLNEQQTSKTENWMIKVVAEEGLEPPTRGL